MKQQEKARQKGARQRARTRSRIITWTVIAAAVGLVGYGVANVSNIAYGEDDIRVVNFGELNQSQKREALEAANTARCGCGCGMTLAQCVSTDMTCPIRDGNIEKIRSMVREAASVPSS
jgi:hypothetical protein